MFGLTPLLIQQVTVLVIGCCLGSFFNVVIHRLPAKESLVSPGSHCPRCNRAIAFYDNVPLLSYILLMGKCRYCKETISFRYPLVEGITGLLALALYHRYGAHPQFLIEFFFVSLLIIITFIDLDTYLIPDLLSVTGVAAGLGLSLLSLTPRLEWWDSVLGIVLGGGIFYLIAIGYELIRHQEGLGGGDIKLLAMIGAFVGWPGVVFTIMLASVVGALVGLVMMWRTRKGLTTMLPFGPFLSLGAVCYIFWGPAFYGWYLGELWGR